MKILKRILFTIFLLLPLIVGAQTTYYVSNTGSDAANGTSEGTAWLTLNKINTYALFNSLDTIRLNRSDTWNERLILNATIHPDSLVISAYGTGAKPNIIGNGTGASDPAIRSTDLYGVKLEYLDIESPNSWYCVFPSNSTATVSNPYTFIIDSCIIHNNDGSSTGGHGFIALNQPRLKITNTLIHDVGMECVYSGVRGTPNDWGYMKYNHFYDYNQSGSFGDCIQLNLCADYFTVDSNIFDGRGTPESGKGVIVVSQDTGVAHLIIENNICYGNIDASFGVSTGRAIGSIIRNNTIINAEVNTGSGVTGNSDTIHNNIIKGYASGLGVGIGNVVDSSARTQYVLNNTFIDILNYLIYAENDDTTTIVFKNNIAKRTDRFRGSLMTYEKDYNMYFDTPPGETNSIYNDDSVYWADSMFIDTIDYKLQSTSLAIDVGTDVGISEDKYGNAIPYNFIPDIGVNEYTPAGPIDPCDTTTILIDSVSSILDTLINRVSQNTGALTISVSGGDNDYTYLWSNSETTQNISDVDSGSYSITVTDGNGCTGNDAFIVGYYDSISSSLDTIVAGVDTKLKNWADKVNLGIDEYNIRVPASLETLKYGRPNNNTYQDWCTKTNLFRDGFVSITSDSLDYTADSLGLFRLRANEVIYLEGVTD